MDAHEVSRIGLVPVAPPTSQIVAARTDDAPDLVSALRGQRIVAASNADRLRVGFHAFNTADDVRAIVQALQGLASAT